MAKRAMRWALLVFTLLLVGCDHATKTAAKAALSHGPPLPIVDLTYTENHDTAFSLTRALDVPWKSHLILGLAIFATVAVCVWWWKKRNEDLALHVGSAFVLAGAIGNVSDRLIRGYVVDFIHVHHWPVFNVADVLVAVGAVVLMGRQLWQSRVRKGGVRKEAPTS